MTRDDVLQILRAHRPTLHETFGVRTLSLYGSVARNSSMPTSDVDLLVEFDRPAGYFALERLQSYLAQILACRVDVSTAAGLRDTIRAQVEAEAVRVD